MSQRKKNDDTLKIINQFMLFMIFILYSTKQQASTCIKYFLKLEISRMFSDNSVHFREARSNDIDFMSAVLIDAASASGVHIPMNTLADHPDAYQYIERFPTGTDVGVIAETSDGQRVGAAWVRLLATDAHAIDKQLPELTMGVIAESRHKGVGKRLMEELYKAALAKGISEISLGVHKDNIPAISLYTKQNWIKDGTFEDYVMMSRKIEG